MIEFDPAPQFHKYAHPERLVSAPWLSARLGVQGLRVIEVDEDALLYDIGHLPMATRINFHKELLNPLTRDVVDAEGFAALMRAKGIHRDDTVVLYGDKSNWWAAYALWIFTLYGHQDVRLLDGGRDAWMSEERDTSYMVPDFPESEYPVSERKDAKFRMFVDDLKKGRPVLVDTRPAEEYAGAATEDSPNGDSQYGTTIRHGHIPGAVNITWNASIHANGVFRALDQLQEAYAALDPQKTTALYSHLGAQGAHTWFVLTYLLGFKDARLYDGSWAEWGNMVRMPIER